jgi:uncharacterized protein YdhG (YjbR/CyaY superfamily)
MPAATVDAYIDGLPGSVAARVTALRETIRKAAPAVTETIKYGMPAFRMGDTYLVYLGAWKKHIALYPIARGDAALEAKLAPYRAEKDTVRFEHKNDLPLAVVTMIVEERVKALKDQA